MRFIFLLILTGCTTTSTVNLMCDGTQSWTYMECEDRACQDYELKQCVGSMDMGN